MYQYWLFMCWNTYYLTPSISFTQQCPWLGKTGGSQRVFSLVFLKRINTCHPGLCHLDTGYFGRRQLRRSRLGGSPLPLPIPLKAGPKLPFRKSNFHLWRGPLHSPCLPAFPVYSTVTFPYFRRQHQAPAPFSPLSAMYRPLLKWCRSSQI